MNDLNKNNKDSVIYTKHNKEAVTICLMFSPKVLGCLPMAHRRQSTSWMVLIFSSSLFFSGSLVTIVTSSPLSVLHTDFTCEFFQRSTPEVCNPWVQFVLMKLSKFLRTWKTTRERVRGHADADFCVAAHCGKSELGFCVGVLCDSHPVLTDNERCFGPQGGKDAGHLHSDITSPNNHATPVGRAKHKTFDHRRKLHTTS